MNIAVLPWNKEKLNNKLFEKSMYHWENVWFLEKKWFEKRGHRYETIDKYKNWNEIDYVLIYYGKLHRRYIREFFRRKMENKLIYVAVEADFSDKNHNVDGIQKLLGGCKYILTWNSDLVDNKRVFKYNIPYFLEEDIGKIPFEKRKLLTAIYGNHDTVGKNLLYEERKRIFQYFDIYSKDFDLYGRGWKKDEFRSYKGSVKDKIKTYHNYRFAISLENTKGVNGYVTEKIFDCICGGVIPIYCGADDILDYVPENVFIDYSKFGSLEELHRYLTEMDKQTWQEYQQAMHQYLSSDYARRISPNSFCETLEHIMVENPAGEVYFRNCDRIRTYMNSFSIKENRIIRFGWNKLGLWKMKKVFKRKISGKKDKTKWKAIE